MDDALDLKTITARDYLGQGFYGPDGQPRPGIEGLGSMATAQRLLAEGWGADTLQEVAQAVRMTADDALDEDPEALERSLREDVAFGLEALGATDEFVASPALRELFEAALPVVRTGRELKAFVGHLERITAQMALVESLAAVPGPPEPSAS